MNKKAIWAIVVIIIIILGVWFFKSGSKNKTVVEGKTIKIGVVAPLTGGASGYGLALTKGIELAKQDVGDANNTYELIFEDDESTPAKAASAAQKLVSIDKVQALITVTSVTGNAVKPIATKAGVTHFCVCADVSVADNVSNFTYLPLPTKEAQAWADEAAARGAKKVAIISQNHPGVNLIVDNVKKDLAAKGISVVFEERYDPATKDFKTVLTKAKTATPDLYLIGAFPPSLDVLAQELNTLGIKSMGGIGTFALAASPELLNGGWYTDASLTDLSFKDRFKKAFPAVRFNARTAPYGYDVFNILVAAFESDKTPNVYAQQLTSYSGKVGAVTKPADGGSFDAPLGIWEIKNGEAVQVK